MQQLVTNLLAALSERIDTNRLMSPETKTRAHEKLAGTEIGYPDTWKDYSNTLVDQSLRPAGQQPQRAPAMVAELSGGPAEQAGRPCRWGMTPAGDQRRLQPVRTTRSYFRRCILQPPFFDPNALMRR